MIIASQIELRRGNTLLLDNASATIYPGHKVGLVGKNGCGKSSFFALLKGELTVDNGSLSVPAGWQLASVAQETPALDKPALEYVIDGDREYRALETALQQAERDGDGLRVAEAIVTERLSETAAPVICEGIASAQPVSGETAFCEKEGR